MTEPNNLHREGFARRMKTAGLASGSRAKYEAHVKQFLDWLGDRHPRDVRRRDVQDYLDAHYGDREEEISPATYRVHVAALKRFYRYLDERDEMTGAEGRELRSPVDRIELPKRRQKSNDFLRPDEDRALLTAPMSPTERTLIYLLRFTGLRISEAVALEIRDVDMERGMISVRRSKTDSGQREVPILDELRPVLDRHLDKLRLRPDFARTLPLFATKHGTAMKTPFAWRIVKRVAERAGVRTRTASDEAGFNVSEVTPHTLRRTFASTLLNNGARIDSVSKVLGHSSTAVTEHAYAQLLPETVEADLRKASSA
jgi:integrase/recombinase XerD